LIWLKEFFMLRFSRCRLWEVSCLILAGMAMPCVSDSVKAADAAAPGPDAKLYQQTVDRGIQFLLKDAQASDGS